MANDENRNWGIGCFVIAVALFIALFVMWNWPAFWHLYFFLFLWAGLGPSLDKDRLRPYSGKTPIRTILWRMFICASVINWGYYAFYSWAGFIEVTPVGFNKAEWGLPRQTTLGWYIDYFDYMTFGYLGITVGLLFVGWTVRFASEFIFYRDNAYWAKWKKAGGSPFFDLSVPWPFNPDSHEVTMSIAYGPPTQNCPKCGGAFTLGNGYQCGNCGLWWNGQEWLMPTSPSQPDM